MVHLKAVRLNALDHQRSAHFPFNVPVIRSLSGAEIAFSSEVTFLIGENGSGKSTFLEALASAARSITVGSESAERDRTLASVRLLGDQLKLSWSQRKHKGFFMRSEDFFGYVKWNRAVREEFAKELAEIDEEFAGSSALARSLARAPIEGQLADMRQRYGGDLDERSHGESYFALFRSRFVPDGLYLLDEPEAPLSPMRQIGLMSLIKTMVEEHNAQFIIATHSPILMAFPNATIYSFDGNTIDMVPYDQVEHVAVTKAFLNNPQRYLRHI